MADSYSPEQLKMIRDAIPPAALEAILERELEERRAIRQEDRRERQMEERAGRTSPQPKVGRHAAVLSGAHKRWKRPKADPDDRRYVPGVLKHFRRVHGLTQREAGARIGYSPKSSNWRNWESGFSAPPYRTLLKIIGSVGLGYWVDHDHRAGMDGDVRLEVDRVKAGR